MLSYPETSRFAVVCATNGLETRPLRSPLGIELGLSGAAMPALRATYDKEKSGLLQPPLLKALRRWGAATAPAPVPPFVVVVPGARAVSRPAGLRRRRSGLIRHVPGPFFESWLL